MRAMGWVFIVVGSLFVAFRIVEHVFGGFIGEISVGGLSFFVPDIPLVTLGVGLLAVGALILAKRRRAAAAGATSAETMRRM